MSRWLAAFRARAVADTLDTADTLPAADLPGGTVSTLSIVSALPASVLPPASAEQQAEEAADRAAIAAEPLLPDPGTPERERLDRRHRAMLAGLLAAAQRNGGGGS